MQLAVSVIFASRCLRRTDGTVPRELHSGDLLFRHSDYQYSSVFPLSVKNTHRKQNIMNTQAHAVHSNGWRCNFLIRQADRQLQLVRQDNVMTGCNRMIPIDSKTSTAKSAGTLTGMVPQTLPAFSCTWAIGLCHLFLCCYEIHFSIILILKLAS